MQDIVAEGKLGLRRAIEGFEPERGLKFSTYAHFWIRRHVSEAVAVNSSLLNTPASALVAGAKVQRARAELSRQLNRQPNDNEIGQALGITADRVKALKRVYHQDLSFEAPMGGDEDASTMAESYAVRLDNLMLHRVHVIDGPCCNAVPWYNLDCDW